MKSISILHKTQSRLFLWLVCGGTLLGRFREKERQCACMNVDVNLSLNSFIYVTNLNSFTPWLLGGSVKLVCLSECPL